MIEMIRKIYRFARRCSGIAAVVLVAAVASYPAFAQCAMCGLSTGSNQWGAIFKGVMVLLIPAALMIGGLVWFSWKHRK